MENYLVEQAFKVFYPRYAKSFRYAKPLSIQGRITAQLIKLVWPKSIAAREILSFESKNNIKWTPYLHLMGFSRSGTSFLQSLLIHYFNDHLFRLNNQPYKEVLALKHTFDVGFNLLDLFPNKSKLIVPVRKLQDALISWIIYDSAMLNKAKILEQIKIYETFFDNILSNIDSLNIIILDFPKLSASPPNDIAIKISKILNLPPPEALVTKTKESIFLSGVGDSTGYDSYESLSSPGKSHLPSNYKEELKPIVKKYLNSLISPELLRGSEDLYAKVSKFSIL